MSYKWWLITAVCLFVMGMALGLTVPGGTDSTFFSEELAAFEQLASILTPFTVTMAVFVFLKNILVLLLSFMFSPLLCLLPAGALLLNGGLLSFVSAIIIQEKSLGYLVAGVLPHGIFEIPALIIGEAAALSFGFAVITALISKDSRRLLFPKLRQNLRYLVIACALLAPAAIIETYATPLLLY